jgi:NADH:ubiquinone oxidoreductase subunit 3 (subunit A)
MGATTLHRLREYSLIAAAVFTVLLILAFWWNWRRTQPKQDISKSKNKSKKKSNN